MNIEDILQSLPSREEIAKALGRNSSSWTGSSSASDLLPALGIFGTGMLFGAGLALLFTPKSGTELRRDLSEKMGEYGNQARRMGEGLAESATHMTSPPGEQGTHMSGQHEGTHSSGGPTPGSSSF